MIKGKTVLAIIPARGGSKGISYKNIRVVGGIPLVAWTIAEAKKSEYIDRLILSSDDKKIIDVAKQFGCEVPFIRPPNLALDETPGIAPVLHAIEALHDYDYIVLLQPTSPLRTVQDIDGCIELCLEKNANSCISVTEPDKSPFWIYTIDSENCMSPLLDQIDSNARRQDLPKAYVLNGAVYVAQTGWIKNNKTFISPTSVAYYMPKERSLDIDTEYDLQLVDFIIGKRKG